MCCWTPAAWGPIPGGLREGISRSALIRTAVEAYLHDDIERAIDQAIIDGYRRIPVIGDDGWGNFEDYLDSVSKGVEGLEPWPEGDYEEG